MNEGLKVVHGRRTVEEYLRASPAGDLVRLILCDTNQRQMNNHLLQLARDKGCEVVVLQPAEFDEQARKYKFTQGVLLQVRKRSLTEDAVDSYLAARKPKDIVVMLDHLEDVNNVGSILRTCGFYGVELVVIPKDRSCDITPAVEKVASGALALVKTAEVTNLNHAMEAFKRNDYWIVGTSLSKDTMQHAGFKWPEKTLLVVGNEHKGLGHLVEKNCDFLLRIDGKGGIGSLNAAVSAAVFLDGYFSYIGNQAKP